MVFLFGVLAARNRVGGSRVEFAQAGVPAMLMNGGHIVRLADGAATEYDQCYFERRLYNRVFPGEPATARPASPTALNPLLL
jgi:hypothetical protein